MAIERRVRNFAVEGPPDELVKWTLSPDVYNLRGYGCVTKIYIYIFLYILLIFILSISISVTFLSLQTKQSIKALQLFVTDYNKPLIEKLNFQTKFNK